MLATLLLASFLQTGNVLANPRFVTFLCADHARDDQHEVDIIDSTGKVAQTILGGDPAADTLTGIVTIPVNVQPVAFGLYTFVVRAVATTIKSDNSLPSAVWQRSPGAPTNVNAK